MLIISLIIDNYITTRRLMQGIYRRSPLLWGELPGGGENEREPEKYIGRVV